MAEFLAEALERELDSGIKELVIISENGQLFKAKRWISIPVLKQTWN